MQNSHIEKLADDLYCITVPQPFFDANKIYYISGRECCLIDGGHPHSYKALSEILKHNGLGFERIQTVFYTHPHIDHVGLAIAREHHDNVCRHLVFNDALPVERWWESSRCEVNHMVKMLHNDIHGFSALYSTKEVESFVARFFPKTDIPGFTEGLKSQQKIELNDDIIHVIHTPGHNPYHMCLYFEKKGYLFTGDMILRGGGTSIIREMGDDHDHYLSSLTKLEHLDARLVLPGHGKPFYSLRDALKRAKRFHYFMKNSILRILNEPLNCYEIAYKLFQNHLNNIEIAFIGSARIKTYLYWLESQGEVMKLCRDQNDSLNGKRYQRIEPNLTSYSK